MTKADLIMALSEFDGDEDVMFMLEGAESPFYIDEVINKDGKPVLTQDGSATFDDICGMADACYQEYKSILPQHKMVALA